jgi:SET domain-containing protein
MPTKTTRSNARRSTPVRTPDLPFELRRSPIQGKGAFATRRIRPGQRIIEYVGEHIDRDEGDRRYDDAHMSRHHTFLFALDDGSVIDAAVGGNEARFINHSCDPNCQAIEEDGRIFIEAIRNIQPGSELLYDYAYERSDDHTEEDEQLYVCKCGSPKCRGSILAPRKKTRGRKKGKR